MTTKDFEAIARVFKREMELCGGDEIGRRYILSGLARMLATEFGLHDAKRNWFLRSCNVME